MITFGNLGLTLSAPVARALLAFGLADTSRRHLCGFGIDEGDVCATDGQAAVRFEKVSIDEGAPPPGHWEGRVFGREALESAMKARKRQSDPVVLLWTALEPKDVKFAALGKVEPDDYVRDDDLPIAWSAALLSRVELAAKACRREREPGENITDEIATPPAILTSLGGYLDPCRYTIGGDYWETAVHTAFVTIMPMNMRGKGAARGDSRAIQSAREKLEGKRVAKERAAAKRKLAQADQERRNAARAEGKAVEKRNRAQRASAPAPVPTTVDGGELDGQDCAAVGLGPEHVGEPAEVRASDVPEAVASVNEIGEATDGRAVEELARLSGPKLAEPWSGRDAQRQILSNVLHGRDVSAATRRLIEHRMTGRLLAQLRFVVASVLRGAEVAA